MGKDSHFTGQPVYSQVLKLLDKDKIRQISRDTHGSESYVKRFGGYEHLVSSPSGVLCQCLRISFGEVCKVFSRQPPSQEL